MAETIGGSALKLLVATDAHLYRTRDGAYYCNALYGYDYFTRYFAAFDAVRVVAREEPIASVPENWLRVDGEGVEVFGIPSFRGPKQLLPLYCRIHRRLAHAADGCDAAMLRVPGQTAHMMFDHLPAGIPVGAEVVADASDYLRGTKNPVLKLLYGLMSRKLARIVRTANGVTYVTREALQKHYPSQARLSGETDAYFEQYCSDIVLADEDFGPVRTYDGKSTFVLVLTDVAMNAERKGERVLLRTMERLRAMGYDVRGRLIGDGTLRAAFETEAAQRGLRAYTSFPGLLSTHEEIMAALRDADIYMLPSETEGLSRGLIEAMAAGLPCLSTAVGGTPELLDEEAMVADPHDVAGFVRILSDWFDHPDKIEAQSRRNCSRAQEFRKQALEETRGAFYRRLAALAKHRKRANESVHSTARK